MKTKTLFKTVLLLILLVGGVNQVWADEVQLAKWQSSTTIKHTEGSNSGTNYYYTPSSDTKVNFEETFSSKKPYFYPIEYTGTQTDYTLTFSSSGSGKKWYISNYTDGAFRFDVTQSLDISDYTNSTNHDSYAEINFPATGYKNLKLKADVSGFGNSVGKKTCAVVVSPDNGTTWFYAGTFDTGNSYSKFQTLTINLGVANCANVKVRIIAGNDVTTECDWYMNNFIVTGEALGESTVYTVTASSSNTASGYIQVVPTGNKFVAGESITLTATKIGDHIFSEWQDSSSEQVSTSNPYNFTVSEDITLSAVFVDAVYYTLTTAVNIPWAGTITRTVVQDEYLNGTELTLTAAASEGYTFSNWSTGATTSSINVTMDEAKNITANFTKNTYSYGTEGIKIAEWTFNGNYDVATAVYTPTGVGHADYSSTYSSQVPTIRPDFYYGANISDYAMSLRCDNAKKWKLENFNSSDRYILEFDNTDDMATVTDYTEESQQTHYFEASFPTLNFKDVSIALSISAHSEPTGMTYGVVFSTDNGSTWSSAGTVTTQISNNSGHWNYWSSTPSSIDLGTATENQEKVIVRIVRQRSSQGETNVSGQNNKLDYFTVRGTVDTYEYLSENSNYTPAAKTVNVSLTRTINTGKWNTIVLPFDMTADQVTSTFGSGTKLARLTGLDGTSLTFSSETTMNANEPYLIYVPTNFSSGTISGVTIKEGTPSKTSVSGIDFIGSYDASTDIPYSNNTTSYYFIKDNQFYRSSTGTTHDTMKGTRAYFKVPGTSAARLAFVIEDNETTGLQQVETVSQRQPCIFYDLQGRRVKTFKKGLYIKRSPQGNLPGRNTKKIIM